MNLICYHRLLQLDSYYNITSCFDKISVLLVHLLLQVKNKLFLYTSFLINKEFFVIIEKPIN